MGVNLYAIFRTITIMMSIEEINVIDLQQFFVIYVNSCDAFIYLQIMSLKYSHILWVEHLGTTGVSSWIIELYF